MDYFSRLAQRALGMSGARFVQPRIPSRYELGGDIAHLDAPLEQTDVVEQSGHLPARESFATRAPAAERLAPLQPAAQEPAADRAPQATLAQPFPPDVTPGPLGRRADSAGTQPAEISRSAEAPPEREVVARGRQAIAVSLSAQTQPPPPPAAARSTASPPIQPRETDRTIGYGAAANRQLDETPPAVPAPAIRVTIGRIDVRAVTAPTPPARHTPQAPAKPSQSLEEYLRAGKGGSSKP
jgi:hypothetical protein